MKIFFNTILRGGGILRVRSRIEELEQMFVPKDYQSKSRVNKWKDILTSEEECYVDNIELMAFQKHVTVKPEVFANTVAALYGNFSNQAAHKILFPIDYDIKSIEQMFQNIFTSYLILPYLTSKLKGL